MNKKVSDYIFEHLRDHAGVDTVFMLPGGGCMHLVDSLGKTPGVKYICNLHEQASAIGAESYAQDKNALGVCLVTAGPGSTNAITGVAGAWIDSTPMLVLSGQAKVEDMMTGKGIRQMGIQEVDTESLLKPVTKYAKCVKDP
ncbi:MAG: thiamine pyrophosphate-binding protein, partial [Lentisphaeria bacterium]|nr:thiamine pyrophosphate-binding protein [Lentisphaeria bacterium]